MLTRRQFFIAEWVFVLGALLTLGSYLAYSQYQDYQRTDRNERARLAQQAAIVEHNLVPQLEAANQALLSVIEDLPHWQKEEDGSQGLNRRLQVLNDIVPGVRTLLVVDAQGTITASNNASAISSNVSKRDWFVLAAKNNAPQTLYLRPPSNHWLAITLLHWCALWWGPKENLPGRYLLRYTRTLLRSCSTRWCTRPTR